MNAAGDRDSIAAEVARRVLEKLMAMEDLETEK